VPENYVVRFHREQIVAGPETMITDSRGKRRPLKARDLEEILKKVPADSGGRLRALASRFIPGTPVGPFRYYGTRTDDPNDTVPHEHRRDLRGLRVFAAWLGHDDSKSLNTLDTLVKEDGVQYVRHYLIDFGASLGSASYGPNSPRSGNDYLFQWGPAARQFLTLGLAVPKWARSKYPDLPATGAFEYEVFSPERWVPEYPNPAFSNLNPDDAFWAAKQVMAFTPEEIRAVVKTGEYSDPRAEDWVVRCLVERRDKVGLAFFARVLPLDRFKVRGGRLEFQDLAAVHFGMEQNYTAQWFAFDNRTGRRTAIPGAAGFEVPKNAPEYVAAEIRGRRPGQSVLVYVRDGSQVVGREMEYPAEMMLSRR
jgi:hypothetical protein